MPTFGPQSLPYPNTSDAPDGPGAFLTLLQSMTVGGAKPFTSVSALVAAGTGYAGQLAVVTSDATAWKNGVYYSNGSAWSLIASPPTTSTMTASGIYSAAGVTLDVFGGHVFVSGLLTSTSASWTTGTTYTLGTVATPPTATVGFICAANNAIAAEVTITTSGTVTMVPLANLSSTTLSLSLSNCGWKLY